MDGYRRAQENFENSKAVGTAVGSELVRRRKEMERRKKNEEEAHNKVRIGYFYVLILFNIISCRYFSQAEQFE